MKRKILFLTAIILAFIVSATGLRQALAEVRFLDDKIIVNGTIKQTMYYRTQMNSTEYKSTTRPASTITVSALSLKGSSKSRTVPRSR